MCLSLFVSFEVRESFSVLRISYHRTQDISQAQHSAIDSYPHFCCEYILCSIVLSTVGGLIMTFFVLLWLTALTIL